MVTEGRSRIEMLVLQCLLAHEAASVATVRQRLPQLNHSSISSALLHLTAERSVRRVKHGLYALTEQGQARLADRQTR